MSLLRFKAVKEASDRKAVAVVPPKESPEKYYAEAVFNRQRMYEYLPKKTFDRLVYAIDNKQPISRELADSVAAGMKKWALDNGAHHYTHWFHPLTGGTAEKHDSFVEHDGKGGVVEEFAGKLLVQQEPDASSFPNGGIRNTFEARGYSAWDISSPVFIVNKTLCIPTIFISYTGESLDFKTPLLRALNAVDKAAADVARYFDKDVRHVLSYLGWEQEYFLVDEALYAARPDLVMTGRTLMGHESAKNQQLEDHYFGAIPSRVQAFMLDLEIECHKLGIPAHTRHNEVAPNQFELAPIFEETNLANDHNLLLMSVMTEVARRHHFRVLLHEKPFAGVNGSGKHNNWSITTDNGENLLDPGDTPNKNIQFLLVLACILRAVDRHGDLLRQSASDVGNDHRLGANEAPPAIISVFLGDQLEDVVRQLVETGDAAKVKQGGKLETGVSTLPDFEKDATDRNRTSPFAFTGNKFEFRMVGSADSIASPNTTLNAIVAEAFCEAADRLEKAEDFDLAVHDLIKEYMTEHQRIVFNGNGYAEEWVEEAEKRGLPNIRSMIEAASTLTTDKAVALFERFGIFTRVELESREEIIYETYAKTINIEALTMIDMAGKKIIPAVMRYSRNLADTVNAVKAAGADASAQTDVLRSVCEKLSAMQTALKKLEKAETEAGAIKDAKEQAFFYKDVVKKVMQELRDPADELEMIVDKEIWPLPTYGELMFEV